MSLPYDEDDLELDDTGDFLVVDSGEDADDADAWVREHVSEHGPTGAGIDVLAEMDREGFFT